MVRRISSSRPMTGSSLPSRARREVDRVLGERLALAFGFLVVYTGAATDCRDRILQCFAREARLFEDASRIALVARERQQEELARDELVATLDGFLVGQIEEIVEIARDRDLAAGAFHLGQPIDRLLECLLQPGDRDASACEERRRAAILLGEQRRQQMLGLDETVVVSKRQALRVVERLLEFGRQLVETHGSASLIFDLAHRLGKTPRFQRFQPVKCHYSPIFPYPT